VTTLRRYEFMQAAIPSALVGPFGQPLLEATFNGETVVNSNHDGSVALPVATGPPPGASKTPLPYGANDNDIYSAYTANSLWEQAVSSGGGGGGGNSPAGPYGGVPFGG
jgi:hypothetical protein